MGENVKEANAITVYDPGAIARPASPLAPVPAVAGADRTDERIVQMWVAGRSPNTQEAYIADARRLFEFVGKSLSQITIEDLQAFAAELETQGLAPRTRRRILAAIKSLFSFASDGGIRHVRYNVAAAIRLPKAKENLNERILTEAQVSAMIAAAAAGRNRAIVELLYLVGVRAEELAVLCWRDAKADGSGGVLTVFGKGEKTRHLRMEAAAWSMLSSWRKGAGEDDPIFVSRQGGQLSTVQIWRIVSGAAKKAGLKASPHWLRHSHATHAIDHGCDLWILQKSLGHASIDTTQQYVHSRPKQSSGAFVKRVGEVESKPEGAIE